MSDAGTIFADMQREVHRRADRLFLWLLVAQWLLAIVLALVISPFLWTGGERMVHFNVKAAVIFGGVINSLPIYLIVTRPGAALTRQLVAAVQMMWSAMFIMITGGRIETHFHVFGSLAFLALYRDWKLFPTATLVVAADHLSRGLFWPDSVYGAADPEWWRFLEHATWVAFEDIILVVGCVRQVAEMRVAAGREAALAATGERLGQAVADRTAELQTSLDRYRALVERTAAIPFEWDAKARSVIYVAPQIARLVGCAPSELGEAVYREMVHPDDRARLREFVEAVVVRTATTDSIEYRICQRGGGIAHVRQFTSSPDGQIVRGVMLDVTRQKQLETELQQAQKLESVGRLAAGVAHEINTPVQFVGDSVRFVRDGLGDMLAAVGKHRACTAAVLAGVPAAELAAEADAADRDADLAYLFAEFPRALDRSLDGLGRVAKIVGSMKVFAYQDGHDMVATDLNAAIESTLVVGRNEYKYVADLETNLGDLPPVCCHPGEINQVVLNIVINAAHAIRDVVGSSGARGRITVSTLQVGDDAVIRIGDTGGGIPEAIGARVFDPFFTTKPVGLGTGQGLAIARSVIVDKHHGSLTFTSEAGVGTTFEIRIPLGLAPMAAVA